MQSDNRTISEIVDDPTLGDVELPAEPELEEAKAPVTATTFMPQPERIKSALRFAGTVQQARAEAHVPEQYSIAQLLGKTFVIVDKVRQKAFLPADGTQRDGWQCLCADVETREAFTVWVGQVTLKKDLELLNLPFKTTLSKRGRAYIFS